MLSTGGGKLRKSGTTATRLGPTTATTAVPGGQGTLELLFGPTTNLDAWPTNPVAKANIFNRRERPRYKLRSALDAKSGDLEFLNGDIDRVVDTVARFMRTLRDARIHIVKALRRFFKSIYVIGKFVRARKQANGALVNVFKRWWTEREEALRDEYRHQMQQTHYRVHHTIADTISDFQKTCTPDDVKDEVLRHLIYKKRVDYLRRVKLWRRQYKARVAYLKATRAKFAGGSQATFLRDRPVREGASDEEIAAGAAAVERERLEEIRAAVRAVAECALTKPSLKLNTQILSLSSLFALCGELSRQRARRERQEFLSSWERDWEADREEKRSFFEKLALDREQLFREQQMAQKISRSALKGASGRAAGDGTSTRKLVIVVGGDGRGAQPAAAGGSESRSTGGGDSRPASASDGFAAERVHSEVVGPYDDEGGGRGGDSSGDEAGAVALAESGVIYGVAADSNLRRTASSRSKNSLQGSLRKELCQSVRYRSASERAKAQMPLLADSWRGSSVISAAEDPPASVMSSSGLALAMLLAKRRKTVAAATMTSAPSESSLRRQPSAAVALTDGVPEGSLTLLKPVRAIADLLPGTRKDPPSNGRVLKADLEARARTMMERYRVDVAEAQRQQQLCAQEVATQRLKDRSNEFFRKHPDGSTREGLQVARSETPGEAVPYGSDGDRLAGATVCAVTSVYQPHTAAIHIRDTMARNRGGRDDFSTGYRKDLLSPTGMSRPTSTSALDFTVHRFQPDPLAFLKTTPSGRQTATSMRTVSRPSSPATADASADTVVRHHRKEVLRALRQMSSTISASREAATSHVPLTTQIAIARRHEVQNDPTGAPNTALRSTSPLSSAVVGGMLRPSTPSSSATVFASGGTRTPAMEAFALRPPSGRTIAAEFARATIEAAERVKTVSRRRGNDHSARSDIPSRPSLLQVAARRQVEGALAVLNALRQDAASRAKSPPRRGRDHQPGGLEARHEREEDLVVAS